MGASDSVRPGAANHGCAWDLDRDEEGKEGITALTSRRGFKPILGEGLATCCFVSYSFGTPDYEPIKRKERSPNTMEVYEVYIIDRNRLKILRRECVLGKDEADAALQLGLTDEEKKLKARDDLALVYNPVGTFEKVARSRVRIDSGDD